MAHDHIVTAKLTRGAKLMMVIDTKKSIRQMQITSIELTLFLFYWTSYIMDVIVMATTQVQ